MNLLTGHVVEPTTSQLPLRPPGRTLAAARPVATSAEHWWPGYEEPIYRELFGEQLDRLAAGLRLPEGALLAPADTAAVTA